MDNHNYMYLCIYRQISRLVHPNLLIVRLSSSSEHCPMSAELSKSGENIAAGYSTVLSVMEGWLKSPGHCANIMSPYFREIGAAKAVNLNSTYHTYWTLDLASKR